MAELQMVTLEELKAQMRVDFDDDDALITLYGQASEEAVRTYCCRSTAELTEENERRGGEGLPYGPRLCVLLLSAHLYRMREPVSSLQHVCVPYTYDYLLKPWVKLCSAEEV